MNLKTKCLIVEDEPLAAEVIENYLSKLPNVVLLGVCTDAIKASEKLHTEEVDLLFLDINMPEVSGIDFLRTLLITAVKRPQIIITTAYRDFAVDAFELNVLDYLVKPIPITRFMQAMNKYYQSLQHEISNRIVEQQPLPFIYVKADKKTQKLLLKDIVYIESLKDYVKIHTNNKVIVTKHQISHFEDNLPEQDFMRIHRSFIIAVNKIQAFNADHIDILDIELPIGRSYREKVAQRLRPTNTRLT
ncbi:LytTR family DNA-binding domain-containing protein [Limibacter armeniacum]|uniref:LytR/AlgR family response regulator transcription factor n=1 Tax=Limibacter armeniacum TaxID=466084 RepID=UPI002FE5F93B